MDRPFVFMKRALLTFKAAGLHPPFLGPGEEDFGCNYGWNVTALWRLICLLAA